MTPDPRAIAEHIDALIDWRAVQAFRRVDCKRCGGTGWWSEFRLIGRGCQLIGGPCDHDPNGRGQP